MKFLALAVVIAVLVAASAAFVSNQSHAVLACVSSCMLMSTALGHDHDNRGQDRRDDDEAGRDPQHVLSASSHGMPTLSANIAPLLIGSGRSTRLPVTRCSACWFMPTAQSLVG